MTPVKTIREDLLAVLALSGIEKISFDNMEAVTYNSGFGECFPCYGTHAIRKVKVSLLFVKRWFAVFATSAAPFLSLSKIDIVVPPK